MSLHAMLAEAKRRALVVYSQNTLSTKWDKAYYIDDETGEKEYFVYVSTSEQRIYVAGPYNASEAEDLIRTICGGSESEACYEKIAKSEGSSVNLMSVILDVNSEHVEDFITSVNPAFSKCNATLYISRAGTAYLLCDDDRVECALGA